MQTLVHAHSGLRWVVLILLLAAIFKSFKGYTGKKEYTAGDKKIYLFALISFHIQYLIGFILYFTSPKVAFMEGFMKSPTLRFFAVEHIFGMTLAMVLITVGYSKSKKLAESAGKHRKIFVFYLLTLLAVLATIPWPFLTYLGANWF